MHLGKNTLLMVLVLVGYLMLLLNMDVNASEEENMNRLVESNNAFAFDLYAKLSQEEGNLFFSPYSISTALAMTYAGARGETETQMAATLHFTLEQSALHLAFASLADHLQSLQKKENIALTIANALWMQQDFE